MTPSKKFVLGFKKKLTTTNQTIWGSPASVWIPTYSSCTAYHTVGTDNPHSTHCSVWWHESTTHDSNYLVHSCACWHHHLWQRYV